MHFSGGLIQTNLCRVSGGVGFGDDSWVQYAEKECTKVQFKLT